MILFTIIGFALLTLISSFVVAYYGKKWNLNPFIAVSSGGLLILTVLEFIPSSFANISMSSYQGAFFILMGILLQGATDILLVPRLKFLDTWIDADTCYHKHSHTLSPATVCSMVGCLTVCAFFDGVRLFAGLTIGSSIGLMIGMALFFHLVSEGALVAIMGLSARIKTKVIILLASFMSGFFIIGALFAKGLIHSFDIYRLVAFTSGILLYVCFIHLLPVALKKENRYWFIIGLLFFLLMHGLHTAHVAHH